MCNTCQKESGIHGYDDNAMMARLAQQVVGASAGAVVADYAIPMLENSVDFFRDNKYLAQSLCYPLSEVIIRF